LAKYLYIDLFGIFNSIFDGKGLALYATGNAQIQGYGYQVFVREK
jgi:hypothetical protein